ncbi:MAG: ATP-binding protein [Alphaproteobacteria bacterium]|nr:ATP-binding protein [Alphaproteobacteria bacterium]
MGGYKRWFSDILKQSLEVRRVSVISGARQCGKTTLAKQMISEKIIYRTLDDITLLKSAWNDPQLFVKTEADTLIIDEIQKAPDLLPSIKLVVDQNNRPGQFLLTGSADIRKLPQVTESLAGRIKNIHLRTLSYGEILGNQPSFMERLFKCDFPSQIKGYDKRKVTEIAFAGGYPEPLALHSIRHRKSWFNDYVDTLISKDLKDISNIKRTSVLKELVKILAAWSSKFLDVADLCGKLSISRPTFDGYLNALESLYLFERVPSWIKTDYARVGKKDKLFMADTGLMASLLNWNAEEVLLNPDRAGKLVETLVYHELSIQSEMCGAKIYHYRDRENREVDFIVESEDEQIACIEVKAGSAISKSDFKHIEWFRKNIAKDPNIATIILYTGENTLSFGDGLLAVPLAALWEG